MNESSLPTTSASGTQNTAENPQTAGNATNSGAVQPGTTSTLLDTMNGGLPLTNQSLTTVDLPKASSSVAQPAAVSQQSTSPLATGISVVLFIVAAVIIVAIFLPTKNTTD